MKLVQSSGHDHIGFTNILIMLWQDNQSSWLLQTGDYLMLQNAIVKE